MSSRGVNKVILIGNCGNAPELRYLPNGNPVANMTLATTDSWKDKQTGQQQDRTEWHRIVVFGKLAEITSQYADKGQQMYVEGRLQTREWEKDGIKRYTTEIIVDQNGTLQLLGSRRGGGDQQGSEQGSSRPRQQQQQPSQQRPQQSAPRPQQQAPGTGSMPDFDSFDDDIPFREVPFLCMI
ncbi:single-stranded DNA-binding protein [Pseudomonas aeruginosa]|uniref:Single-stranded DNA-binding protein n=1 Tax=Aquipseudomonas alcaligenes TaxID=43263 RepID=A0A5C7W1N9_AQUAC|nr:single-stranded DNA-binding protein [Pseudomonas aeruginosa]ASJ88531.1 single-strand binding protein [Pseudomonas aeruginosa]TXI31320.1 MAG: single-stranded DNA-binding protein [Pseudomonas alcaligenes]